MLRWLGARLLTALPGLAGASFGLGFAIAVVQFGWLPPAAGSALAIIVTAGVYLYGQHLAAKQPRLALRWLLSTYALLLEAAGITTGVVLWAGIQYTPPPHASVVRAHIGAAIIALGALLATAVTKPLENADDPGGLIQSAYQRALKVRFDSKDPNGGETVNLAYDALWEEEYSDGNMTVTGWTWRMLTARVQHLQQGLGN
jgi:hypothetical protein